MKRLPCLILFICLFLISCSGSNGIEEAKPDQPVNKILLSQTKVDVEFEPSEYTVSVTSPCSWSATPKDDWIILKTKSGIAGTKELKFTVERNEEMDMREGTIVIHNRDFNLICELYVSQKAFVPEISISMESLQFPFEGGKSEILITSNFEYDVTEECSWLWYERSDNRLNIMVGASTVVEKRVTEIVVSSEKYNVFNKIMIEQLPFEPILQVDDRMLNFDVHGGISYVNILANTSYSFYENVDWISCTKYDSQLKIAVSKSEDISERTAEIIIYLPNYDNEVIVHVLQRAFVPTLEVNPIELKYDVSGGTQYIDISANAPVDITENAEWVNCVKEGDKLQVIVAPSTITMERNTDIIISLPNYNISKRVNIWQDAFVPDISISPQSLLFDADGGEQDIEIMTNIDYNIINHYSWVQVSKSDNGVNIIVNENKHVDERIAEIIIFCEEYNINRVIQINQKAFIPQIWISTQSLQFNYEGGEIVIDITANFSYNIINNCNWISWQEVNSGIRLLVEANYITENRCDEIIIYNSTYDVFEMIAVRQNAFEPLLDIEIEEITFGAEGGTKSIEIIANTSFVIDEKADWVSCSHGENNVLITVMPSYNTEDRSADLEVSLPIYGISKIVKITQDAFVPTLVVEDVPILEYSCNGGLQTIAIDSNFEYDIKLLNADWITINRTNTGLSIVVENYKPNTYQSRMAELVIYSSEYNIESKIITILQKVKRTDFSIGDLIVHNDVPGVVYFVSDDVIKVVSAEESSRKQWSTEGISTYASDYNNGQNNMATIMYIKSWESKYPAFKWCADLGEGWYLPARNELTAIYKVKTQINETLNENGYTPFDINGYWSSTEDYCAEAFVFHFSSGGWFYDYKHLYYYVRGVTII